MNIILEFLIHILTLLCHGTECRPLQAFIVDMGLLTYSDQDALSVCILPLSGKALRRTLDSRGPAAATPGSALWVSLYSFFSSD